jgi:plasmid stabilization system protein ParE
MSLRYTDRATDDLDLAFAWYERQRRGLGFDFLDCVEVAVNSILDHPEMYQVRYGTYRSCLIRRFPCSIFYTIEGKDIVVHAVFDNRQDPKRSP